MAISAVASAPLLMANLGLVLGLKESFTFTLEYLIDISLCKVCGICDICKLFDCKYSSIVSLSKVNLVGTPHLPKFCP